jgi:hypothetical protein
LSRAADAIRRVRGWLARGGLFGIWALAGWGTLLLLLTAWGVLPDGPGAALARLVPGPHASLWAWLNSLSALLALAVWLVAAGLLVWSRLPADDDDTGDRGAEETPEQKAD